MRCCIATKDGVLFDFAEWRRGKAFLAGSNGLLRKLLQRNTLFESENFTGNITHHIDEFNRHHSEHYQKLRPIRSSIDNQKNASTKVLKIVGTDAKI